MYESHAAYRGVCEMPLLLAVGEVRSTERLLGTRTFNALASYIGTSPARATLPRDEHLHDRGRAVFVYISAHVWSQ